MATVKPRVRLLGDDSRIIVAIVPLPDPVSVWDRICRWIVWPPKQFDLASDVSIQIDGKRYTIHTPFRFDGFTIPRGFRWLASIWWLLAAAVHDDMLKRGYESKEFADAVFRELLVVLGCPKLLAIIFHKAVRIGGEGNYPK